MSKINNSIVFILMFFSLAINATEKLSENEIMNCQDQIYSFGDGKGDDEISDKCISAFKAESLLNGVVKDSEKLNLKFFGHKNLIIVEKKISGKIVTKYIAGESTQINDVKSFSFDEKNFEVAVLDNRGEIYIFTTKMTGNIAPLRTIKSKELKGASDLVINSLNDEVIVYNEASNKLVSFSRHANIHGRKGKQKLNILKTTSTNGLKLTGLKINSENNSLQAFDKLSKQLKKISH